MIYKSYGNVNKRVVLIGIILFFGLISIPAIAQTTTPTPVEKSKEEIRLEEEKRISELRKQIAENERAEQAAKKAPAPTTTPLAGQTTVNDTAVIESQILAYAALGNAANRIVGGMKLKRATINNLAIFNESDVKLLLEYQVTESQIALMRQGYCSLFKENVFSLICPPANQVLEVAPLALVSSILGSFVDMTALLRTNVDIRGTTFDIDERSLVSEIFRASRNEPHGYGDNINLYYPSVFPPNTGSGATSKILQTLEDLETLRENALKILRKEEEVEKSKATVTGLEGAIKQNSDQKDSSNDEKLRIHSAHCRRLRPLCSESSAFARMSPETRERYLKVKDIIKTAETNITGLETKLADQKAKLKILVDELNRLHEKLRSPGKQTSAQLTARNAQVVKFIEALTTTDSKTGLNSLTNYIRAENLRLALPDGSFWLQVKVIKAGGNNRIRTNLVWDIFRGGNRLTHSGGVIVQYILFDATGNEVVADTLNEYIGYTRSSDIERLSNKGTDVCVSPTSSEVKFCHTEPATEGNN